MKTTLRKDSRLSFPVLLLLGLTACGGGSGGGSSTPPMADSAYMIGGMVTGLTGSGLVLQNNAAGDLAVTAAGPFSFAAALAKGAAYAVTVKTQPSSPTQNCVVYNGSGTAGSAIDGNLEVICSTVGRFAYAANAADNTVSVYAIDSTTGALAAVGTAVATGTSPYAIAARPDGQYLYVGNRISSSISVYAVNAASGALTAIPGSPFATGVDPQALAFDPSGAHLYVANNGSDNLSAYAVNVGTGALLPIATAYATGTGPSAVSVSSDGAWVFVANNGGSDDISVFAITAGTGALTPAAGSPFAAGGNPHSLVLTPIPGPYDYGGAYLFTANFDGTGSTISGFSLDWNTGALTALTGSPFAVPVSNYIGTDRTGADLYVTTGAGVVGYRLDEGTLTALAGFPVASGSNAYSSTVDPSNQFLYVANDGSASISGYKLDSNGGGLSAVPGSPFAAGSHPDFIAIL